MEWVVAASFIAYFAVGCVIAHMFNIYIVKVNGEHVPGPYMGIIAVIWGFGLPLILLIASIKWIDSKTLAKIKMYPLTINRKTVGEGDWVTEDLNNYVKASQNNNRDDFFEMAKTLGWEVSKKDKNVLFKVVSRSERVELKRYRKGDE